MSNGINSSMKMVRLKPKIVSIGTCYIDINVGAYPFQEAGIMPDTELVGDGYEAVAGGSAVNSLRAITKLGALEGVFVGTTGDDIMADVLEKLLAKEGIDTHLQRKHGEQTNVSFNMTNTSGKNIMLTAGTANQSLDRGIIDTYTQAISGADYAYLGGVFKLKNLQAHLLDFIDLAHERGAKVVVDHGRIPAQLDDSTRKIVQEVVLNSDIYLPSHEEFLGLWGMETVEQVIDYLHAKTSSLLIVVKNGAGTVRYFSESECGSVKPLVVTEVHEVTGAGDMFNGVLLSSLSQEASVAKAIQTACEAVAGKIRRKA